MTGLLMGTAVAIVIVGSLAIVARSATRTLVPREGWLVRCVAAWVVALLVATLVFHALLAVSRFDRLSVVVVMILVAACSVLAQRGAFDRDVEATRRSSWDYAARSIRTLLRSRRPWPLVASGIAALFVTVTVTRALSLPTVGWDSITYHYVKAGMWVQSGGPITLDAPGGWSMYRAIFGGGEIFTAWSMLPFGNDMLAGAVDICFWLANAVLLFGLGREFGLRVRHRAALSFYGLFVPAVWDAVGWGYVDLTNTALLLAGLLLASRYLRSEHAPLIGLSMAAFGLAAGTKLTAVPVLASAGLVFLWRALGRATGERGRHVGWLAAGSVAAVACIAPWLIQNLNETGYPLRFPMKLFGIALGADNPAFAWSQDRELPAYALAAEFAALRALFQWPWVNTSHLGVASLVPLALALLGAFRVVRSRPDLRLVVLLAGFICGAVLLAFYDRAFAFSRLEFTWVNGRFLEAILFMALPLAFAGLERRGRARDGLAGYLVLCTIGQLVAFAPLRFLQPAPRIVFAGLAIGAVVFACACAVRIGLRTKPLRGVALGLLALVGMLGLDRLREIDSRYMLLVDRNVSDDVYRYWWQAAHLAEREGDALRIAVTAGPRQDADNWLMYYFMGADLQNTLHYLPISTDGDIIPFGPGEERRRVGDVDAWLKRLAEQEISHVFSFFPTSVELTWMEARPDRFLRLSGNEEHWAFYRVIGASDEKLRDARMTTGETIKP